jgi:hypothetical protein
MSHAVTSAVRLLRLLARSARPMDKTLQEQLELASRRVIAARQNVERQRAVIRSLERDDHDSSEALWLLGTFERLLRIHVRERDRLERAMAPGPH